MSKRAIEKAYVAYPLDVTNRYDIRLNANRVGYQEGYEQAEKDITERVCNVLSSMLPTKVLYTCAGFCGGVYSDDFIKAFRKKLEEE